MNPSFAAPTSMRDASTSSTWPATFGLFAAASAMGTLFVWIARRPNINACVPEFVAVMLAVGVLYFAAISLIERFRPGALALLVILAGAVAFRLILLPLPPALSDDVYRYQWEGRVQRGSYNPYTVTPTSLPAFQ